MEAESGTDQLMIRTDLKAALHPTAPQYLSSSADEHAVDLLASDLIIAIPAPAIDVLVQKPGTVPAIRRPLSRQKQTNLCELSLTTPLQKGSMTW